MQKRIRVNNEKILTLDQFIHSVKLVRKFYTESRGAKSAESDEVKTAVADLDGLDVGAMMTNFLEESLKIVRGRSMIDMKKKEFKPNHSFAVYHKPTGEDWYCLGANPDQERVCVAGFPATIGLMEDCVFLEYLHPLTEQEKVFRAQTFGADWL